MIQMMSPSLMENAQLDTIAYQDQNHLSLAQKENTKMRLAKILANYASVDTIVMKLA
jgi:hypothetical protein